MAELTAKEIEMIELNQIYNEDCLEGMKKIPDGSVDMVLCDPPFGTTDNYWDQRIPFEPLWAQYKRITKKNAAIVLFAQLPFGSDLIQSNRQMFRYEWIWEKNKAVGFLNARKMPLRAHENILVFYEKLPTYNPQKRQGKPYCRGWQFYNNRLRKDKVYANGGLCWAESKDGSRYPLDVLKIKTNNIWSKHYHSTQKPIDLLEYLIKTYTNEGELVLDNCIGSGSTAVAAINTNRNFIGFETDAGYCEIANKRIAEAYKSKK